MNRFRFRLQSVLKYREAIEETKKRDLGVSMSHLRREEEHFNKIQDTIKETDREREQESQGSINVRVLNQGFYYSRLLERKKNDQKKAVERAEKIVEIKRNDLSEAVKRRKILERLREKKVEEYNVDASREEQALIDDSAIMRFDNHGKK
jgi:flagellar protein FliJ